jgi:hypothetical protein
VLPASPAARVAIALAIAVPALVVALLVLTTVLSVWVLWAIAGWGLFGRRYGYHHDRYRYGRQRLPHGGPRPPQRRAQAGPGPRSWV